MSIDNSLRRDAYHIRGKARFELGDYQGSIDDYTQLLQIGFISNVEAYNRRSMARSALGDYQGAIEDLQKAANQE